jgi:uncharacterized protein involved in type VI secretion and phage assembly
MTEKQRYFGKYRGTVAGNDDPENRGRLQVVVPDVLGDVETTWAEACVPLSGAPGVGMGVYVVPPVDAAVWVEFEYGDPNLPVWVGCRYPTASDVPSSAASPGQSADTNIVIQSTGENMILISDDPTSGGITLKSSGGAQIQITDTGITLTSGDGGTTISMTSASVDLNSGALTVMA